jgi:unsaturated rhamnogalacturonyl hydrolase
MPGREGNYEEASASCMFVYAAARGVRQGYLPAKAQAIAADGWRGILQHMIAVDEQGQANLGPICAVAGLGGDPYRDGSYAYYVGERRATNDLKGVGPFILAALEMERQPER